MRVYLDHNATTPVSPLIQQKGPELLSIWGNPSSIHWAGRESKNLLRETRRKLAQELDCHPLELVFNSGGTEGNNTILKSVKEHFSGSSRNHFLISSVEHPSVLRAAQNLGVEVELIPVRRDGQLDLQFLSEKISERTALVSVMTANNETGSVFPLDDVVKLAKCKGTLVHTDAVQALGKIPLSLKKMNVDYASFSGHKFYSLKGVGFVFVKKGAPYQALMSGGGQERHRRGGTENVMGIASLGLMAPLLEETGHHAARLSNLRNSFEEKLLQSLPGVKVTAVESPRLSNTSSLIIEGVDGETLLMSLDLKGFAVSTGAACSSGNPEPSPVLLAMGLSRSEAQSSLRVSLGWQTTENQMESFLETLVATVERLRRLNSQQEVSHG